jgi:hypothetical protein
MESKIIRPEPNKPITGLVVERRCVESKFGGEQVLVTLEGGKLLYLPAGAARAISAGHAYTICKKQIKDGLRATWDVRPAEPEPEPVRGRVNDPRMRVEPAYDEGPYSNEPPFSPLERKLQESIDSVARAKAEAAAKDAAVKRTVRDAGGRPIHFPAAASPSRLTAALCTAVDAAGMAALHAKQIWGVTLTFNEEQIKCLAITAYIQNVRSSK